MKDAYHKSCASTIVPCFNLRLLIRELHICSEKHTACDLCEKLSGCRGVYDEAIENLMNENSGRKYAMNDYMYRIVHKRLVDVGCQI